MAKILIIEDNLNLVEEVLSWLLMEDYEAIAAYDGREGVEMALKHLPDLILCDIMMPQKDGYRVLLELRAQTATALTPFIFLTAKQDKNDVRHGMELGADDYITKPFSHEEFLGAIRSRLERRQLFAQDNQQQLSNLRHNLLRMLPHELRTPLVGILGMSELITEYSSSLTTPEIVHYAELITLSGKQLFRLIENHLLYTQLEAHAANQGNLLSVSDDELSEAGQTIRVASERAATAQGRLKDLQFELQPGIVRIEGPYLAKIVHELVDNACKFSKSPTKISVTVQQDADKYSFTVADHGRGMSADDITHIAAMVQFDREIYEQQGAGLGLIIARRLAELYGGSFQMESRRGQGTQVHISLRKS